jgi:UDP-N-acetylglucosamine diphosphorylase / glucose-1-phosphate thymidylyltransferase / UDP-N-acetylgalactosamine diphosphorylase / glucosamine-1-phosphate N-acetyltransferase / galactosamine-1-phosphate N-acetyltransferase
MHVVIFEGNRWKEFAPLCYARPIFMMASGASTLLEKQLKHLAPSRVTLWVRPELAEWTTKYVLPQLKIPAAVNAPLDKDPALLISGRTVVFGRYDPLTEPSVMMDGEIPTVRTAYVIAPGLTPLDVMARNDKWQKVLDLPKADQRGRTAHHLWDLIDWNEEAVVEDSIHIEQQNAIPPGPYHIVSENTVFLGNNVELQPGCVLDGSKGPVIIGDGALIGANAVLQGPCYVGRNTAIRPLAFIRAGTTIGPGCKIGGEVSNAIVLGNSNKSHQGFLGDSYLGEFVNLGAGTNTSNLKNTYGQVTVQIGQRKFETGRRFVGSVIGDHTKTSIGTRLTTGAYVGYGSMVAHAAPPHFIPSFTFLTDKGPEPYRREKSVAVMEQVRARRGLEWGDVEEKLLDYVAKIAKEVEGA